MSLGLTLPAFLVEAVARGVRELPLAHIPGGHAVPAGDALAVRDATGATLALGVADPDNDRLRLYALADEGVMALDDAFVRDRLAAAIARRTALGLPLGAQAFRLVHGAGDGLPGLTVDALGEHAVLWAYSRALLPLGRRLARALVDAGLRGVVVKVRGRGAAARQELRQEIVGATPPDAFVAREGDLPVEIHPLGGVNHGLFTDMREQRAGLHRWTADRRVLNGFAYTGTLSAAAARAGATVTSVDLSSGVLAWARDNFRHAGLDAARHDFVAADCGRFLDEAARAGRAWDTVLLDPPTFSTARGAEWQLERDYPALITRACRVLAPEGTLWLASNTRALELLPIAETGVRAAGREAEVLDRAGLPACHPTVAAQPEDRYLQIVVLRVAPARVSSARP